ncbi:MAG: glycosyl hydrolase 115 family protein [Acidobacteriaceae bacterium]|nr:glycosyl hydrolase 115 family protein [Acidobacteriaceae bacterium]
MSFIPTQGSFTLADGEYTAAIVVDRNDWAGVLRAAGDLSQDIERVTTVRPRLLSDTSASKGSQIVIIGTIGKSALIDSLISSGKLDVSAVKGKWECAVSTIIDAPLPGVARALVIAGSDKRGTIFGIYDLSEQIGVSPWYWWADVRVPQHKALYVMKGQHLQSEPAVKYRGIFLNDEAPSLTGWAHEKFGGLNSKFYAHIFELLLRLKANYLWPAMWGNAFNEDDPENPRLADEYGIVMGTSHHEPMLRSQQEWKRHGSGPWNYATNAKELQSFWRAGVERNKDYESSITIGMRGDGDIAMSAGNDIALLERIVHDQRQILSSISSPVLKKDMQVWALYKEVQGYYEGGMRVPDDVTLLWCDDNWGDIRRLPTPEERKRSGGAGIYYHFDYVGDPRNYKWINTNPIPKVWEQMHLALEYGADRLWVVNVGDLKPMEFPIEFFLTYARQPERWNQNQLHEFAVAWATREFGAEHAEEIARDVEDYTRYNGRRKPELITPNTFSVTNFAEADRVDGEWESLRRRVDALAVKLPEEEKASYFELVQYPADASATVTQMYIAAARNALAAQQGRSSTNDYARRTEELFHEDAALSYRYNHDLLNGRWDHMMDQVHIGYTSWNDPPKTVMPKVSVLQPHGAGALGISVGDKAGDRLELGEFDSVNRQTKVLTVYDKGQSPVAYQLKATVPWIILSQTNGELTKDTDIAVSIDWATEPKGVADGQIVVSGSTGEVGRVSLTARRQDVDRESADGFVEGDGYIAIEAAHTSYRTVDGQTHWVDMPMYGRTVSGVTPFPVTAASAAKSTASLDYQIHTYDRGDFELEVMLSPSLNFAPGKDLRFGVSIDDGPRTMVDVWSDSSDEAWRKAVSDAVRKVRIPLKLAKAGDHVLHIWFVVPGVVIERCVLSHRELPYTYLGPPESFHANP